MTKVYSSNLIFAFIGILFCMTGVACKKNRDIDNPVENPPTINKPPKQFAISLLNISSDTAAVSWTQAVDPENDSVSYKILINDTLKISNYTRLSYTFKNLKALTNYTVKVIAVDSKKNEAPQTLSITTKKYWLTFLKKVEYGSISGYSSQKTGQMIKANDGNGYVIVGESEQSEYPDGPYKMFTIKIDTLGNKVWEKFYDYGVGNTIEIKIINRNDNGYIISGGNNFMSIDNQGNLIWHQSTSSLYNIINGISLNNSGQIYTVGSLSFDSSANKIEAILSKYDPNGNLIWDKKFSPSIYDEFYDLKVDANGQIIVLGLTEGTNISLADYNYGGQSRFDFWVSKMTSDGVVLWSNSYPKEYNQAFPENIIQTKEGNYVFTGFTFGPYDIPYMYLQMIDANGSSLWNYFSDDNYTKSYSVSETNDNSIVVAGGYSVPPGAYTIESALYKFDKNGNKLWEHLYPEFATFLTNKTVIPTADGGCIINCQKSKAYNSSGETDQIYIFKTNDLGEFDN